MIGAPAVPRTVLQRVRDVALTVMALLVSALCAFLIYVGVAAGSALADLGNQLGGTATPAPAFTWPTPDEILPTGDDGQPCVGEEPVAGC